jgi:CheY-like chemotaxis protein
VARVLICDPHEDILALLELVVRRLGHEPVVASGADVDHVQIDAAVVEPGDETGLALARRLRDRGVPLVLTSIYPADDTALELEPSAYLVKPFPLYALERALQAALADLATSHTTLATL